MKMMRMPAVPAATAAYPATPVQPVARTRSVPPPQPKQDTGAQHTVTTGRGVVPQKPHNPANHVSAMPTVGTKG